MEPKLTFGGYIRQRRKELGMTQREFADRLFVTDSAVSKWERDLSYPDITLLRDICSILEISEHELLTASEDVEARSAERLARKYRQLTRANRWGQISLYTLIVLICLVCDLAGGWAGWSLVVVGGELVAASLTLIPALAPERQAGLWVALAFPTALLVLYLTAAIYTGTWSWLPMTMVGTLFGLGLVLLPYILRHIPLPACLRQQKLPVYLGLELLLLLAMYAIGCAMTGGDWFLTACFGTLFGLGLVLLPLLMGRLPECLRHHKAALWLAIETALLLTLEVAALSWTDFRVAAAVTVPALALPWLLVAVIRYVPLRGWFRAAICLEGSALWVWLYPWAAGQLTGPGRITYSLRLAADLRNWSDPATLNANVFLLTILALTALALLCALIGLIRRRTRTKKLPAGGGED